MSVPVTCPACLKREPTTGRYFVSAYPPFDHWSADQLPAYRLALARTDAPEEPLGLYVHIPFCEQRYDDCAATLTRTDLVRADRLLTSFYLPAHQSASA